MGEKSNALKLSNGKKKYALEGNLMKLDKKKIVSILAKLMRKYKKSTLPANKTNEVIPNEDDINSDDLKRGDFLDEEVSAIEDELQKQGIKRSLVEQIKRFILSKSSNSSLRDPYADIGSIGGAVSSSARNVDVNAETRHSVHINLFDDKSNKGKKKCSKKKDLSGNII